MDYEEKKETKFNAALASLERLHNLLIDCNKYSRLSRVEGMDISSLKMWRVTIHSLFRELSPKIEAEDKKEISLLFSKSKKIGSITYIKKTQDGAIRIINPNKFYMHWKLLDRIETKLRKCADKRQMLIPDKIYDPRFSAAD